MYSAFLTTLSKFTHKLLYSGFSLFFLLYNGIGIAYVKGVYEYMFFYYIIFYLSFSTSYLFFLRIFYKESIYLQKAIHKPLSRIADNRTFAIGVLSVYLFTKFLPLIYPEFLAYRLINPPPPDILGEFMSRYETTHPVKKLSDNLGYLVYPFYLLSLYTFRKNIGLLIFALLIPLYLEYVYHAYLHRSALLFPILTVFVIIGQYYKRIRFVFFCISNFYITCFL